MRLFCADDLPLALMHPIFDSRLASLPHDSSDRRFMGVLDLGPRGGQATGVWTELVQASQIGPSRRTKATPVSLTSTPIVYCRPTRLILAPHSQPRTACAFILTCTKQQEGSHRTRTRPTQAPAPGSSEGSQGFCRGLQASPLLLHYRIFTFLGRASQQRVDRPGCVWARSRTPAIHGLQAHADDILRDASRGCISTLASSGIARGRYRTLAFSGRHPPASKATAQTQSSMYACSHWISRLLSSHLSVLPRCAQARTHLPSAHLCPPPIPLACRPGTDICGHRPAACAICCRHPSETSPRSLQLPDRRILSPAMALGCARRRGEC